MQETRNLTKYKNLKKTKKNQHQTWRIFRSKGRYISYRIFQISLTTETESVLSGKMTTDISGYHPAWDIIIPKLDFQSQMKISQLNQRFADFVGLNAGSELRKFKRHIREDKYM